MATDLELQQYYADLLILQYRQKPKAYATIKALAKLAIINQLPITVQNAFDLNTAVGVQLDTLGIYVGASRTGFDFSGPVSLSDSDFLLLIKIAIVQNNSGSSLSDIQNLLAIYFPGILKVFDHQDMRISYLFDSNAASIQLAEVFVRQGRLPKPMGVQLAALIFAPVIDTFFGFRTYYAAGFDVSPFNTYSSYASGTPWLSYSDALVF